MCGVTDDKSTRLRPNSGPPCPVHHEPMVVYSRHKRKGNRYFKCRVKGCNERCKWHDFKDDISATVACAVGTGKGINEPTRTSSNAGGKPATST